MSASINKPANKARLCPEMSNLLDHAKRTQELAHTTAELASLMVVLMFNESPQSQPEEETERSSRGIVGEIHLLLNDICGSLSSIRKALS